jgi:hypothetical protein
MPFNGELEDFAQAFSSGYGMVKSKEEKESEALDLQAKRDEAARRPTTYQQEDTLFGLKVDTLKGGLTDAEAARERAKIDQAHTDAAFDLDQQIRKGQISDADAARERAKIDNAHKDAVFAIEQRKGTAEANQAEYLASDPVRQRAARADEATIKQSESAARLNSASAAGKEQDNELGDTILGPLKEAMGQSLGSTGAVDAGYSDFGQTSPTTATTPTSPPGTGYGRVDPNAPSPVDAGTGPARGVDVPEAPAPEAPAPEAPAPAEAVPASDAVSSIFGGAERKPIDNLVQVPDDSQHPAAGITERILNKVKDGGKLTRGDVIDVGRKTALQAVKDSADMSGITKDQAVNTPDMELNLKQWLNGGNGADSATGQMVLDTIDEATQGKLNPNEKLMAAIGLGQLYWSAKGEPEKAKAYAIGMVEYGKRLAVQYSAFAQAAAHHGDPDATAMAAMRAYAHVANGQALDVSRAPDGKHFIAEITDLKTGKMIHKQLMSPEELMAQATQMTPDKVLPLMMENAGYVDKTISDADAEVLGKELNMDPKVVSDMTMGGLIQLKDIREKNLTRDEKSKHSLEDREAAVVAIDRAITGFKEAHPEQAQKLNFDDPAKSALEDIRPIAERVVLDSGLTSDRALRAVVNLIAEGPGGPVKENEDGTLKIHMPGIDPFNISVDDYTVLRANRNKLRGEAGPPVPSAGGSRVKDALEGLTAVPTGDVGGGIYAPQAPTVYDPNRPEPIVEGVKKIWHGLTAVPEGPVPPYNPSGRPGYDRPLMRP